MMQEAICSQRLQCGGRTYFFDLRKTKSGDEYLQITESRRQDDKRRRTDIVIFKEHFKKFTEMAIEMIKKMNSDKKIIIELTHEEVKLLAYGAMPRETKEKLMEIACHLDEQDRMEKRLNETEKDNYSCQKCGRPINHRGNCLPCNLSNKK